MAAAKIEAVEINKEGVYPYARSSGDAEATPLGGTKRQKRFALCSGKKWVVFEAEKFEGLRVRAKFPD